MFQSFHSPPPKVHRFQLVNVKVKNNLVHLIKTKLHNLSIEKLNKHILMLKANAVLMQLNLVNGFSSFSFTGVFSYTDA